MSEHVRRSECERGGAAAQVKLRSSSRCLWALNSLSPPPRVRVDDGRVSPDELLGFYRVIRRMLGVSRCPGAGSPHHVAFSFLLSDGSPAAPRPPSPAACAAVPRWKPAGPVRLLRLLRRARLKTTRHPGRLRPRKCARRCAGHVQVQVGNWILNEVRWSFTGAGLFELNVWNCKCMLPWHHNETLTTRYNIHEVRIKHMYMIIQASLFYSTRDLILFKDRFIFLFYLIHGF